jgi:hypothetical protein
MQLYHHDNGDLEFRRRDIVWQSVTEFNDRNEPIRAWLDLFQVLYPFNGYKGIPGDAVQIAYGRHFFLEPHDILADELKPKDDGDLSSPFISKIANLRGFLLAKAKKPKSIWDKLTVILGASVILEMILWGIMIYVSRH